MQTHKTITLRDVAEAANVSISTVSRALTGHPTVNPQRAEQIRRLAEQMNYQAARGRAGELSLPPGRRNIAIVSLGVHRSLVSLPVMAAAINGVEQALAVAGGQVQLIHLPELETASEDWRGTALDGVVLIGAMHGRLVRELGAAILDRLGDRPRVWLMGRPEGCEGSAVTADDYAVGTMAADYLVEHGHRHLAFINPKPDHILFMRREDAFVSRARRLGAIVTTYAQAPEAGWALPIHPPQEVRTVQGLVDRLLEDVPRPTAIFTAADSVATLVYGALGRRGLSVGRDISVISGNNDHALVAGLHPSLTTIDIHADRIGCVAGEQLVHQINRTGGADCTTQTILEPTLVTGRSVQTKP